MLVLKNERLVWKQLCARNKVFNRLEALHRKPSPSTAFNTSSKTKKYICTLTFYQVTWLTYSERWFKWVEPLARCAKRGSSLPLGTPMEIDFTSAYLHYPLPQCNKIVSPIIFSISYELFRLPSAKVHQDYQLLRTFDWCLMEKLTRNNGPFLDMSGQLIQSIKAMPMGAWLYF